MIRNFVDGILQRKFIYIIFIKPGSEVNSAIFIALENIIVD